MPYKPQRPCAYAGCSALSHDRYCPAHAAYGYAPDLRPTSTARGYGVEWRRLRLQVLQAEPRCRTCGAQAVMVDHIVPLKQRGSHDISNLQPLCRSCHQSKTRRESIAQRR